MIFHPMIGGGASGLSVKSYASEEDLPVTAKDGDIAVISTTNIGKAYVQSTEPTEAKSGDVWITFTATGSLPAVTGGAVIHPKKEKQYNGSEWVGVPVFVFNSGKWNSPVLVLLDRENTADETTGGWAVFKYGNVTIEKTADGYEIAGQNGGYQKGAIQTVNKIDVTDYKKLVFSGNVIRHNTYGDTRLGLMDKVGTIQHDFESGFLAYTAPAAGSAEYTATLDVSSYSGDYYITALTGDVLVVSYIGLEE